MLLIERVGSRAVVTIQSPISLDAHNRPQPAVAVPRLALPLPLPLRDILG